MSGPKPPPIAVAPPPPAPPDPRRGGRVGAGVAAAGFTLLEMMIVSVILGTLAALALPRLNEALHRAQVARAVAEVKMIEVELYDHWSENGTLPDGLAGIGRGTLMDPWGRPYRYLRIAGGESKGAGQYRKDRFLVPLNSDFDLYSMGRDGQTQGPLSAAASQDDVVRANDGGFVGLASEY